MGGASGSPSAPLPLNFYQTSHFFRATAPPLSLAGSTPLIWTKYVNRTGYLLLSLLGSNVQGSVQVLRHSINLRSRPIKNDDIFVCFKSVKIGILHFSNIIHTISILTCRTSKKYFRILGSKIVTNKLEKIKFRRFC